MVTGENILLSFSLARSESRVGSGEKVCRFELAWCGNASDREIVCKQMNVLSVSVDCRKRSSCFARLLLVSNVVFGFCVLFERNLITFNVILHEFNFNLGFFLETWLIYFKIALSRDVFLGVC